MRDSKNLQWSVGQKKPDGGFLAKSVEHCLLAVLMDLRDELQEMNHKLAVLECRNFINIPRKLDRIGRNTDRRKAKR